MLLWGAASVAVALIGGGGIYVAGVGASPDAEGTSSGTHIAASASPGEGESPAANPSGVFRVTGSPSADAPYRQGDAIPPNTGCSLTTGGAAGHADQAGALSVEGGLTVPVLDGFDPTPVNLGFVRSATSMKKTYSDIEWDAFVVIGVLERKDGFTGPAQAVGRAVGCLLTNSEFYPNGPTATVEDYRSSGDPLQSYLVVEVPTAYGDESTTDRVVVAVVEHNGKLHTLIAAIPKRDDAALAALDDAVSKVVWS